jgi:hypothetical protein
MHGRSKVDACMHSSRACFVSSCVTAAGCTVTVRQVARLDQVETVTAALL